MSPESIKNPTLNESIQNISGFDFFGKILPNMVGLGLTIGVLVFFFVMMIGAIQWITSGGDKAGLEAARGKLANALIGIIILLSIFAIMKFVGDFIGINLIQLDFGPLKLNTGGTGSNGGGGLTPNNPPLLPPGGRNISQ